MKEKLVIKKEIEERFIDTIITFAKEEGLTINNIEEAVAKVKVYMQENATLNKLSAPTMSKEEIEKMVFETIHN